MPSTKKKRAPEADGTALVAIKIDVETMGMLDELCADLEAATSATGDKFGGRSHTIRRAIRFAHGARPWRRA